MQKQPALEITWIELGKLLAHRQNANVMSPDVMRKLRRHIEKTGRYEPLVVRPHPTGQGCFELINGHHRKEILEALGKTHAACVVWELNDAETLMLLATINRLGGKDAADKRLDLLESLSEVMVLEPAELAKWLPEEETVLSKLMSHEELPPIREAPELNDMDEPFTVFLKAGEKKQLVEALRRTNNNLASALMTWASGR